MPVVPLDSQISSGLALTFKLLQRPGYGILAHSAVQFRDHHVVS